MGTVEAILLGALALLGIQYYVTQRRKSSADKALLEKTLELEESNVRRRAEEAGRQAEVSEKDAREAVSNFRRLFDAFTSRKK